MKRTRANFLDAKNRLKTHLSSYDLACFNAAYWREMSTIHEQWRKDIGEFQREGRRVQAEDLSGQIKREEVYYKNLVEQNAERVKKSKPLIETCLEEYAETEWARSGQIYKERRSMGLAVESTYSCRFLNGFPFQMRASPDTLRVLGYDPFDVPYSIYPHLRPPFGGLRMPFPSFPKPPQTDEIPTVYYFDSGIRAPEYVSWLLCQFPEGSNPA